MQQGGMVKTTCKLASTVQLVLGVASCYAAVTAQQQVVQHLN
jgi:hypothetical protein